MSAKIIDFYDAALRLRKSKMAPFQRQMLADIIKAHDLKPGTLVRVDSPPGTTRYDWIHPLPPPESK